MNRISLLYRLLPAVVIFGVLVLLGAGARFLLRDQSLTRAQQSGVIRIGYAVEPPFAFLDQNGEPTGESIEIAKRMAKDLGIERIEWVVTSFDTLIPELQSKRFDVIAAGMFITPERLGRVSFARPTFVARSGLLVLPGNPRGLRHAADVCQQSQVRVAVLTGAVEGPQMQEWGVSPPQIVMVPDAGTGRVAVESGIVDGLVLSSITVRWMSSQSTEKPLDHVVPFERDAGSVPRFSYGGHAFRKEDIALRQAWDQALAHYLGSIEHLSLLNRFGLTLDDCPTCSVPEVAEGR